MLPQRTVVFDLPRAGKLVPPEGQDKGPLPSACPQPLQILTNSRRKGAMLCMSDEKGLTITKLLVESEERIGP